MQKNSTNKLLLSVPGKDFCPSGLTPKAELGWNPLAHAQAGAVWTTGGEHLPSLTLVLVHQLQALFLKSQDVQNHDPMRPNSSLYEVAILCVSKTDDVGDKRKGLNFPCLTFFPGYQKYTLPISPALKINKI